MLRLQLCMPLPHLCPHPQRGMHRPGIQRSGLSLIHSLTTVAADCWLSLLRGCGEAQTQPPPTPIPATDAETGCQLPMQLGWGRLIRAGDSLAWTLNQTQDREE